MSNTIPTTKAAEIEDGKPREGDHWWVAAVRENYFEEVVKIVRCPDDGSICFWADWGLVREADFKCWKFIQRIPSPSEQAARDAAVLKDRQFIINTLQLCQRIMNQIDATFSPPPESGVTQARNEIKTSLSLIAQLESKEKK